MLEYKIRGVQLIIMGTLWNVTNIKRGSGEIIGDSRILTNIYLLCFRGLL